jgi:hypothetical protein
MFKHYPIFSKDIAPRLGYHGFFFFFFFMRILNYHNSNFKQTIGLLLRKLIIYRSREVMTHTEIRIIDLI